MNWMKDNGLGGVMLWSIDMDDFRGNCGTGKFPLLNEIVDNLGNYTVALTYEGPYESTGTLDGKFTKNDRKWFQILIMYFLLVLKTFTSI